MRGFSLLLLLLFSVAIFGQWNQPPAFSVGQFPPFPSLSPPSSLLLSLRFDCCYGCCCCPPPPSSQIQQPPLVPPSASAQHWPSLMESGAQIGRQPIQNANQFGQEKQQLQFPFPLLHSQSPPLSSPSFQSGPLPGSPTAGYWPSLSEGAFSSQQQQQPPQVGFLPNYRGDKYTDPNRIQETHNLNAPFFQQIGGEPIYPGGDTLTPAQSLNGDGPNRGQTFGGKRRRKRQNG